MTEYMIYGFLTPEAALVNRGYRVALAQGKRPSVVPSVNVRTAMEDIKRRVGDLRARLVLAYYLIDETCSPERDYAIALASNDIRDGLPNDPPSAEVIEKLRQTLGVKSDGTAAWYYADKSPEEVPRRM